MSNHLPSLAVIGAGKMGGAILEGVVESGASASNVRATTRSEARASALRQRGVSARSVEHEPEANHWAVSEADVVILAVKPAGIISTLAELSGDLKSDAVVVSVAAGIPTAALESVCQQAVVRVMPNTPAQIRRGVSGVAAGMRATDSQVQSVVDIFELVGSVLVVEENQINALSAISGSGPAYLFYIAEQLTELATQQGFSEQQAMTLVEGTLTGAAALLELSGQRPSELRAAVTSPGGTTQAAITAFDDADLRGIFREALSRAVARAEEMAAENS